MSLCLFVSALKALPASFTKDYRTALAIAPEMFHTEAHPMKFLRCCQGDPWRAAVRLCHNLTFRREVFGPDHWLKPMRLSRDGALQMEDVEFLRTGTFLLLTATDGSERQVMVVNFGRLKGKDHGARKRIVQYLCVTQINEYTQRNGLTVLMVIDGTGVKVRADNGKLYQASHTVSVFTIDQVILANDPNEKRQTLAHLFLHMMRRMAEKFWGKQRLLNVIETTCQATLEALIARGVHPSCIPTQLGGTYSYDRDFKEWLAMRICTEQAEARQSGASFPSCFSLAVPPLTLPLHPAETALSPSFFEDWEDANHQKQPVVGRLPTTLPQSTWNFSNPFANFFGRYANGNNTTTNNNNNNTRTIRTPAASLVDDRIENTDDDSSQRRKRKRNEIHPTDFVRKRNCEYSKKHYYKKKNQVQRLQGECNVLAEEQSKLKEENRKLTDLLHQAQSLVD